MLKIKNSKKAELSSTQIVTIVLLITGFLILFVFVSDAIAKPDIDRQVCHESVVLRGTFPDTLELKDIPSLKCKTRKMCITNKIFGKGECEENLGKEYDTLRISKDKDKAEEDIKKILADELADCWSMMGEGKIQVFKRESIPPKDLCVICSRINFDKNIDVNEVSGLSGYLIKKKVPNKDISYFQFLTDSKTLDYSLSSFEINKLDTKEKAIIFTEFYETKYTEMIGMVGVGLISLKLAFVTGPLLATAFFVVGAEGVKDFTNWIKGNEPDYFSSIYIANYNSDDINKLGCDVIKNIP